ncbi:MAG: prepilin-type N-terminal cleavage/methylation domain-containing protein [Candidatus Sulfobium sp.]
MITERKDSGFTLVELMITMVIFVLVIAGASQVFTGLLTQFKQQGRISETNIGSAAGLEIMRHDIGQAGYGLPWDLADGTNVATYQEAANDGVTAWDDTGLNDASNPPAAVRSLNNVPDAYDALNTSDVLAIKAANVATNDECQKWTYVSFTGTVPNFLKVWNSAGDDPAGTDQVIVLDPAANGADRNILKNTGGGNFYATLDNSFSFSPGATALSSFDPDGGSGDSLQYVIYDIAPAGATPIRMPFNRADYYIRRPGPASMPVRCAPDTGILYKAVVNQSDGLHTEYPILDCVADMEVVYGQAGPAYTDDTHTWSATDLRNKLKEVRVYILAQEGQKDPNFKYTVSQDDKDMCGNSPTKIYVGEKSVGSGKCFDISTNVNYRWKKYILVVTPDNLE